MFYSEKACIAMCYSLPAKSPYNSQHCRLTEPRDVGLQDVGYHVLSFLDGDPITVSCGRLGGQPGFGASRVGEKAINTFIIFFS